MSEKTKFHSFTKPIRFRRIKLFLKGLKDTISSVIITILYKLHIIKRHYYRDNTEREIITFGGYKTDYVSCKFLESTIKHKVICNSSVNEEWYYYKDKNSPLKIISQDYKEDYRIVSSLSSNITIKVDGSLYRVEDGLPVFKVGVRPPEPKVFKGVLREPKFMTTYNFDMNKIRSLTHSLRITSDEVETLLDKQGMEQFISRTVGKLFNEYLETLNFTDFCSIRKE